MEKIDIWSVFDQDPTAGVAVFALDGEMLYVNDTIMRIRGFEGRDPASAQGKNFANYLPEGLVSELLQLFQKVADDGRPFALRILFHGRQLQSTFWPLSEKRVLTITRFAEDAVEDDRFEVVSSQFVDLGPLDCLTKRQLEILALLGNGLTTAEIAEALHRSPKTVENHRAAIARKLRAKNSVDLARLAWEAGLNLEDAKRTRIQLSMELPEDDEPAGLPVTDGSAALASGNGTIPSA